jgi:myo-inositol catabolism protein IolC
VTSANRPPERSAGHLPAPGPRCAGHYARGQATLLPAHEDHVITVGYPDPLFLCSLGDRERPCLPAEHLAVVWDALLRLLDEGVLPAGELGVLAAEEGRSVLATARERGLVIVVPVGRAAADRFELAFDDEFARHVEEAGASVARVALSWNAGHAAEEKKAQAMALSKLAAWLHGTDRKLLVDVVVPPVGSDLELVGGDRDRFRIELHPELVRRAVQEIRDLGVEPDLWVTEPAASEADARELAELTREAGRDDVALLVADAAPDGAFDTMAGVTGYGGFVAGRSVWGEPLAALADGGAPRDEAVRTIARAFGRRLEGFRTAKGG